MNTDQLRTVFRLGQDAEAIVRMQDLKVGDRFRMEELARLNPVSEPVKGRSGKPGIWSVDSDPYQNSQGTWTVECTEIE